MAPSDWLEMTPSDWLAVSPSEWMERAMPGWQAGSYGDLMRAAPSEWWSMMYAPFSRQTTRHSRSPVRHHRHHGRHHHDRDHCSHGHHPHHHHDRCDCEDCCPPRCECFCCIGDVDIVVYTRLGEQRVVAIIVENERRREKEISLELSSWTTRGGREGLVETVSLQPQRFTLQPCGKQHVTLVVKVRDFDPPTGGEQEGETVLRRPHDVDDCEVVTADLRLVGCDHRTVRIAVAVVPRDCDPSWIRCGCTCC
jgi:hypothetical protein